MYACILIPRELSLVLTLHPNPVHVLEMSATVWSNAHLSPGTVFYPDEGEVRLDRLDNRTVLRDDDVRRVYGCYDAIMNINGQEVRHCNWVRFVKMTNDPESANVISSKVRGQAFYQVTRPIKPNEEIVVLFHLTAERSLYDRMTSSPFASHSPTLAPHPLYSDMQTPFVPRPADDKNTSMLTSTPISMATARRNSLSEGLQGQRRSLTFGSSSSSSSSLYASPLIETPNNTRQKKRNIPHESSFTSPMFTSSSSSRETTASEDQSREVTVDASSTKGDDDRPEVMVSCPKRELEETSRKDDDVSVKEEEITAEDSDDVSGELKIDEDDVSDDAIDHGTTKRPFVDSTNETYNVNEDSEKRDTVINDANTATSGAESVKEVVDDVSNDEDPRPSLSEPVSPSPVPAETTGSAPEGQDQVTSSTNLYQHSVSHGDHHHSSEAADYPSKPSVANSQSGLESRTEISVSRTNDHSPSSVFGDDRGRSHSLSQSGELNLSRRGDVRASETENIFSSPNETRPFPTKFRGSPTSIRSLDLPSKDALGHPPVKRCRERTWWPCDVCGKKFDRPSLLKRHTRTHTGEKPHACDVCGKAFSTSSSLNTHRRIHSGEKPHQCKICGKRFTASSNLYYHRMTHNKEKPHKCDLCSKSFPTPGDLRSHMYIHNGSWPFRCDVCNRGFSKQTNLKNHMLLHSGDKPHECPRCGKKFALSCNLKTHLKTHENSDSSDCTECMKCGAALENPAELRDNMCKRCLDSTRRVYPKTSSTSSSKQRHTDFSISKLTSTDDNKTDGDNSDVRPEKPFPLMMPSMTSGKMKTMTSTGFVTSLPQEVPPMYRQFFTTAFDQARWFVPPGSPHLLPSPCIPGTLKQPSAFQSGSVKSGDGQTPQPAMNKLATPSPAHPVLPSFITPDMMSLRGGGVYSSGIPALPPGFPLHPGTAVWGSHVIAQGF